MRATPSMCPYWDQASSLLHSTHLEKVPNHPVQALQGHIHVLHYRVSDCDGKTDRLQAERNSRMLHSAQL
jgi:hypothetical protein